MNYNQKKQALKAYREKVHAAMHDSEKMYQLYHEAMKDLDDQLKTNQRAFAARLKIEKVLTAYIRERGQIASDAYYFRIDPLTGLKVC